MNFGPSTCTMSDTTRPTIPMGGGMSDTTRPTIPIGGITTKPSLPGCHPAEVPVTAGQVLRAALVTDTQSDGYYRNNACQSWNVASTQGQVRESFTHIRIFSGICLSNSGGWTTPDPPARVKGQPPPQGRVKGQPPPPWTTPLPPGYIRDLSIGGFRGARGTRLPPPP